MSFRCPECGKDFGKDMKALEKHRAECGALNLAKNAWLPEDARPQEILNDFRENGFGKLADSLRSSSTKRKKSVDLLALKEALNDGRLRWYLGFNGELIIENIRSKQKIEVLPNDIPYEGSVAWEEWGEMCE